jgi:hypothetical protein
MEYGQQFFPLRMHGHQNQNWKHIGNLTTLLKPHNIGTHLKGIVLSGGTIIFEILPLLGE